MLSNNIAIKLKVHLAFCLTATTNGPLKDRRVKFCVMIGHVRADNFDITNVFTLIDGNKIVCKTFRLCLTYLK